MRARKKLYGVGLVDVDYPVYTKSNGVQSYCPYYKRWSGVLERCYCPTFIIKQPTYTGSTTCEDWLKLSNFKAWMEKYSYVGLQLDKDILVPGNKVYSPDTCAFVPRELNCLLTSRTLHRGDFPLGVTIDKRTGKFGATISRFGKAVYLGTFSNPQDAHVAWQLAKANQIEDVVSDYSVHYSFRADVADSLINRAWQLRLDSLSGTQTIIL